MRTLLKMTVRSVRTHPARFFAILLIVALSAGFFAGLKITTDAMLHTGEEYLAETHFYDFRLLSTLGFTEDEVQQLAFLDGVKAAEGSYSVDALLCFDEQISPYKIYALNEHVNLISLEAGRMPSAPNECLADIDKYTEADIGRTFSLSDEDVSGASVLLKETEFTIVGLCNTPLYLGIDRGSTDIGSGSVNTFLYLPKSAFSASVYTEIGITLSETAPIYSSAYSAIIDDSRDGIQAFAENAVMGRYQAMLKDQHLTTEEAAALVMEEPAVYLLTRNENAGYVSFESDTGIIDGVSYIFPVFFIAIAILVCMTTMSRMVDEERIQIGVLKALGFSKAAIMGKYLLYAAFATVIGWLIGYFSCTWALPKIFWFAYNEIYNFAPIPYLFSLGLALLTLLVSMLCILGSTYFSCRKELSGVPAALMRPRVGKAGRRVLLERIRPLWKRLSFLRKITLRNMFLYKQRMLMMLVGIGCCAGLLVTAFGVRDSMIDVGYIQYHEFQTYDLEVSYGDGDEDAVFGLLKGTEGIGARMPVRLDYVSLRAGESMSSVHLLSYKDAEALSDFWHFQDQGKALPLPKQGEALISPKIAEKLSLSTGDTLTVQNTSMQIGNVRVAAVFDNHIYDYVILSDETYEALFGAWSSNTALIAAEDSESAAKALTDLDAVTAVLRLSTMESNISGALECLNYIIWLIVFFSGALAFIVIFNLTNINIAERRREIATVRVLGFYPRETESYVLRENLVLSVIASVLGLPLGTLFHTVVMSMVRIDLITFNCTVTPISYLFAFLFSLLFAVIVNGMMKRQVAKVNMAESLKAVE